MFYYFTLNYVLIEYILAHAILNIPLSVNIIIITDDVTISLSIVDIIQELTQQCTDVQTDICIKT